MVWKTTDPSDEFKIFKQRMELTLDDQEVTNKAKQAVKIKLGVGSQGLRALNSSGLTEDQMKDPQQLWKFFEDKLTVKVNFRIHRLELMKFRIQHGESVDNFVQRCKEKGSFCDFEGDELTERIIEVMIASTRSPTYQKSLLEKPKGYKVDALLTEGRQYEAMEANTYCLKQLETETVPIIGAVTNACRNCGRTHPPNRCPAYRATCHTCNKKGHWASMCQSHGRDASQHRGQHRRREHSPSQHGGQHHRREHSPGDRPRHDGHAAGRGRRRSHSRRGRGG